MPSRKHPDRTKVMSCRECGNPVTVSLYRGRPVRCLDCASDALAENLRQLIARSGPYYDAWRLARFPGERQEGRGSGPDKDSLISTGQDALLAGRDDTISLTGVGCQAGHAPCRASTGRPGATVQRDRSIPHARSFNS